MPLKPFFLSLEADFVDDGLIDLFKSSGNRSADILNRVTRSVSGPSLKEYFLGDCTIKTPLS